MVNKIKLNDVMKESEHKMMTIKVTIPSNTKRYISIDYTLGDVYHSDDVNGDYEKLEELKDGLKDGE